MLRGLRIEACSSTATACARWSLARSSRAYAIAASGSSGFWRYRAPSGSSEPRSELSDAVFSPPTEPVASRGPKLEQPPADRARTTATAAEASKCAELVLDDIVEQ